MKEMTVDHLNVDLIQDSAMLSLSKQVGEPVAGKSCYCNITVSVPISAPGNQPEGHLKKLALDAAKKVLRDAIHALENHRA